MREPTYTHRRDRAGYYIYDAAGKIISPEELCHFLNMLEVMTEIRVRSEAGQYEREGRPPSPALPIGEKS